MAVFCCHAGDPGGNSDGEDTKSGAQCGCLGGTGRRDSKCKFCDACLARRFRQVPKQITAAGEPSIPFACQDAAQSKAAYRFFSNPRVDESAICPGICTAHAIVPN
ncbi:transposase DNA-binding-containing protein [Candidimonas sp. SYP-B2681]|uniref:IS4/Tn5 family transposase DNA-binding protein n=1 Tax=Candidimonas sp. SYP-B2681 TaxID=2497686 RepID=UPI0018F346EB